jgi:hypothetical protein
MTDLTNILTNMVAERDGIHPAHAANRVALAIRVVEAATDIADHYGDPLPWVLGLLLDSQGYCDTATEFRRDITRIAAPRSEWLSDDTVRLALEIVG